MTSPAFDIAEAQPGGNSKGGKSAGHSNGQRFSSFLLPIETEERKESTLFIHCHTNGRGETVVSIRQRDGTRRKERKESNKLGASPRLRLSAR